MDKSITREVKEERDNRLWEARSHWQHSSEFPSVCTSNGRWLFSSKNNASCVAMLTQQLRHEDIMHERNEPQYDEEGGIPNAAWLFLSRGADERAMYQVLTRVDIRESRRESRIMHKIYEMIKTFQMRPCSSSAVERMREQCCIRSLPGTTSENHAASLE